MPDEIPRVTFLEVANLGSPDHEDVRLREIVRTLRSGLSGDREIVGRWAGRPPGATPPPANDDGWGMEGYAPSPGIGISDPLSAELELAEAQEEAESEVEGWVDLEEIRVHPSSVLRLARARAWLAEARGERRDDAERGLFAAALAVGLARSLQAERHPEGEVENLQAAAWAELANARRLLGDLAGAERGFLAAARRAKELPLLWKMAEEVAALLISQRAFGSAEDLLGALEAGYLSVQDRHAAGRVRLRRGLAALYRQDDRLALEHFLASLRLLDLRRDPAFALAAFHNTIASANRLGHHETARAWLARCAPLYEKSGRRTDLIRRRWAEGQIEAGLGNLPRADSCLLGVRKDFEDLDLAYEAAIVTLDLCEVWLRRGKFREVARGVDEAVSAFQALKIRREALAGLLLLQEAARAEQATVAMVQAAGAALRAEGR